MIGGKSEILIGQKDPFHKRNRDGFIELTQKVK